MEATAAHLLRGQATRRRVLASAVRVATMEGLDALTIRRIAEENGISKAGLLGHFASKQALQVATLDLGRQQFIDKVVAPAVSRPVGAERLTDLLDRWISYVCTSEGGCFFASVAAEFDARPGAVRDHVASLLREWIAALSRILEDTRAAGHLSAGTQPEQMAFELLGHELSLNLQLQLLGSKAAIERGRAAIRATFVAHATPAGERIFTRMWKAA